MAVDLTPRFRRLNSQTRSFRLNGQSMGCTGPFRATQLWRNIIQLLQSQVEVRRRRHHLCVHNACFTGADAVDVVLSHLMQNVLFSASEVSRLKATRLCQALMEARVFEPVGTKLFRRHKEGVFEDTGTSLYRFLDSGALTGSGPSGEAPNDHELENWSPEEGKTRKRRGARFEALRTFSNPLAVGSSDWRVERLLKTISLQPTLPSTHTHTFSSTFLSKKLVEEVWRQQTLLQLLQVVELPVLDSLLTTSPRPFSHTSKPRNHDNMVISNTCVEREVTHTLSLTNLDGWLTAAVDCLELFPDQVIVVVGEQLLLLDSTSVEGEEKRTNQKRLLYDVIGKHYNSPDTHPLLDTQHLDILIAVLDLLDSGRSEEAVRASQLCMRLLPSSCRDELRRLLTFMAAAADPCSCRLQKQGENRPLVCKTFLRALLQTRELTKEQGQKLILFLMDTHAQLFKTPVSLINAVRKTLQSLQQGADPVNLPTFGFCQQVSQQQYVQQREQATMEGLAQLIQHISSSTSLPARDKKRLLKNLQKHHPVAFLQHFTATF